MQKKIIAALAALFVTTLYISIPVYASESGVVTVMSEKIYLENRDDSAVLANMLQGSTVEIIMTVTDDTGAAWYYVRTDTGLEGYMPVSSVSTAQTQQADDTQVQQEIEPAQAVQQQQENEPAQAVQQQEDNEPESYTLVTLDNVNIRQEPSVSSTQLGNIIRDTELEYTAAYTNEEGEIWYAVTYQGITGYITADAVDTGERVMEPQPWTTDTEAAVGNETNTTNDTVNAEENQPEPTQETEETVVQETEPDTVQSDVITDIQIQETQISEETKQRGLRLPELFEIGLCAGIILCVTAIIYFIQKIRLTLKKR